MADPVPVPIRGALGDVTSPDAVPIAPTDDELMAALMLGELAALERLYDRYASLVFSVSLRVLYDRQLAEDVTQEVFLRLWRRPQSYDPERGRLLSWLMSVTRNRAIDERRRLTRRSRSEQYQEPPQEPVREPNVLDDPQVALALTELRRIVRGAMSALPPAQREVIELGYFGGLTQTEISARTGVPLGTVKTRVRLALRKLRATLGDFDGGTLE